MGRFFRLQIILRVALVVVLLMTVTHAWAEHENNHALTVQNMQLSIWPEYDRPGVLVVYSGQIVNTQATPYTGLLAFNVPLEVQEMELVCEAEAGLHCVIYQLASRQQYKQVSWQASQPIAPGETLPFLLEFYYDPLSLGSEKSFEFIYFPTYPIEELYWDIKEPFEAEEFVLQPQMELVGMDMYGFKTYQLKEELVSQPIRVAISYQREQETPSIDRSKTVSASVGSLIVDQVQDTNRQLAMVLIGFFMSIIGYFAYYAYQNRGKEND